MSGSETIHDRQRVPHPDNELGHRDGGDQPTPRKRDAPTAYEEIGKLVDSKKNLQRVPGLVAELDSKYRNEFKLDYLGKFVKIAPGDQVLAACAAIGYEAKDTAELALAAKQPVGAEVLRRYVAALSASDLDSITGTTFDAMRDRLDRDALAAIPNLVYHLGELGKHRGYVAWVVKTTAPGVLGRLIPEQASEELARSIDALKLWDRFIDHIAMAKGNFGVARLAHALPDGNKHKAKLIALAGPVANADPDKIDEYRDQHAGDVAAVLAGKPTLAKLVEAIGEQRELATDQRDQVIDAVLELRPSADELLALSDLISLPAKRLLPMLVAAKGVTSDHIIYYLTTRIDALEVLRDGALVDKVRARAPKLKLTELIATPGVREFHTAIVGGEALRRWFFASATATDLLWFCGASVDSTVEACRYVAGRPKGWKWVRELTSAADRAELSRAALNCHDEDTTKYIHEVLLGAIWPGETTVGAKEPAFETRAGQSGRLVDALTEDGGDVMARLTDLDAAQRARIGANDTMLQAISKAVEITQWPRVAVLLELSFRNAIVGSRGRYGPIVTYLRTRPPAEEAAALAQPACVKRAAEHVHKDLLLVFPSLADPAQLAKALARMPELIDLLIEGSAPNRLVELFAREPARAEVEAILDERPVLLQKLPSFEHLTKQGRDAVKELSKHAPRDGTAADGLDSYRKGHHRADAAADDRARAFGSADALEALPDAIDRQVGLRGGEAGLRALLDTHRAQVPELLANEAYADQVDLLAERTSLPPHIAIPWLKLETILASPNGRRWYYSSPDAFVLLDVIAGRAASARHVARDLTRADDKASGWLDGLPVATALTDAEDRALDHLQPNVQHPALLHQLFAIRFGVAPPVQYDAAAVHGLYGVLSRLPRAHLQQGRIKQMIARPIGGGHGMWHEERIHLDDKLRVGDLKDNLYPHASDTSDWMLASDFTKLWGVGDKQLAERVAAKTVDKKVDNSIEYYRVASQHPDRYTAVVLHEVGHQVDDILGNRTDPVYKHADWRVYGEADFDTWAAEMGGWDRVSADDKRKIRDAWLDARRSGTQVKDLVDGRHPARKLEYRGVGIVDAANSDVSLEPEDPLIIGDRGFMFGRNFYSLSAAGVRTAPSKYSLSAPEEYFAETYVEYYIGVDGTPGSQDKKGGILPTATRRWFDEHVDKLRFDPRRFERKGDQPQDT